MEVMLNVQWWLHQPFLYTDAIAISLRHSRPKTELGARMPTLSFIISARKPSTLFEAKSRIDDKGPAHWDRWSLSEAMRTKYSALRGVLKARS